MRSSTASSSRPAASKHVLALFGPTASGKTAVAGTAARPSRGRRDLRRLGGALRGAAGHHRGARLPGAASSASSRSTGTSRSGEYQRLAHAAIDEAEVRSSSAGTGLYLRAALSALELPPPPAPERRAFWQAEVDRLGPEAAHAELARRDPRAAERVHANDRKRLVRALELAEAGASLAPETDRLWTEDTRLPDDDRRARRPARGARPADRRADAGDGRRGRRRGGAACLVGPALGHRTQGARSRGVRDPRRRPRRSTAVAQATRRLARYQRKWLRRMPGVVTLDGTRTAEEIADDIVALERSGEHLSRHD